MTEPPRRKCFQIHLSTAIVMMFVAGVLIWANVRNEFIIEVEPRTSQIIRIRGFGWPWNAMLSSDEPYWKGKREDRVWVLSENRLIIKKFFTADIAVAFAILFGVAFCSEYLIRRRAARKGA